MKRNPKFKDGYFANREIINVDGQVVCICDDSVREREGWLGIALAAQNPRAVQEEHPELFDGTESADAWVPLERKNQGKNSR